MTKLLKVTTIILTTLILGVVVSGCVKKPQTAVNFNQPVNTNTSTTTAEIDTSDWKTYRNEQYGFEFKHPSKWNLVITKFNESSSPIFYLYNKGIDGYLQGGDLRISFYATSTKLSLGDWFERNNQYKESDIKKIISFMNAEAGPGSLTSSDITTWFKSDSLNEREAILQYVRFQKPGVLEGLPITEKYFFIMNNGTVLTFVGVSPTGNTAEKLLDEFDDTMKTLKFN